MMADIIDFGAFLSEPDRNFTTREELLAQLEAVRTQIARLDEQEPASMDSEAYDAWGDRHEELEDLADELLDLLDELGGPDA